MFAVKKKNFFGLKSLSDRAILITMFVLVMGSFIMMFIFPASDKVVALGNYLFSLIGQGFSLVIFEVSSADRITETRAGVFYRAMVLTIYLQSFLSSVTTALSETLRLEWVAWAAYTVIYFCFGLMWLFFWKYTLEIIPKKPYYKYITAAAYALAAVFFVACLVNPAANIFFTLDKSIAVYNVDNYYILSWIYLLIFLVYCGVILNSDAPRRTKYTLFCYIIFPFVGIISEFLLLNFYPDFPFDIQVILYLLPLYLIFTNIHVDRKNRYYREQSENSELKTAIMISQIQPHFMYNSLATIRVLCEKDPALAARAIDHFSDYLRMNMDSLRNSRLVPFTEELKHIATYLWLEQLRFGEDLRIEYSIGPNDFLIPPLTVQPLVENAVKHGVCKKMNGGVVKISTFASDGAINITVFDDGAGFDPQEKRGDDGRSHIGIDNVRSRLELLCGGTLSVKSRVGGPTVATVTIPSGTENIK